MAEAAGAGAETGAGAGAGAGTRARAGRANGSEGRNDRNADRRGLWRHVINVSMDAVWALITIVRVHLGDGVTLAKPGERLEHTDLVPSARWADIRPFVDTDRPARAPMLISGKEWHFVGPQSRNKFRELPAAIVEKRKLDRALVSEDVVVVFREGMAFPTKELISVVNKAHAVLVLRGKNDYFYLRADFVLSAREEEALVEWGVRRPLFGNALLAVGGTLLVAIVEKAWEPAVVGTLLVVAAEYRIQGALTKVLRVRSRVWKSKYKLVPSRVHGTERLVQGMLLTLVALADLLDNKVCLLTALVLGSMQVVLLEYAGQALLTWGTAEYHSVLRIQLLVWTGVFAGLVAWVWLAYVFAGFFGCISVSVVAILAYCTALQSHKGRYNVGRDKDDRWESPCIEAIGPILFFLVHVIVGIAAAVLGWNDADLKFSPQSLQPWRWPLLRVPDSFSTGVRIIGLWSGAAVACFVAVYIVVGVFSFRISGDGVEVAGLGGRTIARKRESSPGFSHYDEQSIPSRNLLVPDVV